MNSEEHTSPSFSDMDHMFDAQYQLPAAQNFSQEGQQRFGYTEELEEEKDQQLVPSFAEPQPEPFQVPTES